MVYSKVGPFANNSAPGIDQSFLNGLETWITQADTVLGLATNVNQMKLAGYTTVKNGSTSGTMTITEVFANGSAMKIVVIAYVNYRNASTTAADTPLHAPFTSKAQVISDNIQGTQFLSSGSIVNIACITTLGSTADGAVTSTSKLNAYSMGYISGGFDTIREPGSNAAVRTGNITIIGF